MEWAAHRVITLLLPCEDEQWIRMQLLRDPDWFRMMAPEVGGSIFLDMPEMGVEGDAIVEAIELCPEIEIGEGRVVTATFHHSSGECLKLDIEGEDEPLRVAAGHPIWMCASSAPRYEPGSWVDGDVAESLNVFFGVG